MGVKVREKPPGSGIYWIFIHHQGKRKSKKIGNDEKIAKEVRVHDLRHSYATIRLLKGHNVGDVSYQLGHSSIQITYDAYGHWIPGQFKSEIDELDEMHPNAPQAHPAETEG
jgi:integrase